MTTEVPTTPQRTRTRQAAVDLYWLPLGAGGHFVRMNGRVYEALSAWRAKRPLRDLYHSALVVTVPAGTFVIEQAWPIPGGAMERGVVAEGPVGARVGRRLRVFRYEVRCWRDGVISDLEDAVASPQRLSTDVDVGERLLELVSQVPTHIWGRDEIGAGEMWNSNSLIAWLLVRGGIDIDAIALPSGGRAPGWMAGAAVARRQALEQSAS